MGFVFFADSNHRYGAKLVEDSIDDAVLTVVKAAKVLEQAGERFGASGGIDVNFVLELLFERVPYVLRQGLDISKRVGGEV
jgi:hypothetical protein